jgi:hypothetical protein
MSATPKARTQSGFVSTDPRIDLKLLAAEKRITKVLKQVPFCMLMLEVLYLQF